VKKKLDDGELTVEDIMAECNVSQSLVYKWRADVKRANCNFPETQTEPVFSELVVERDNAALEIDTPKYSQIIVRSSNVDISIPAAYPVADLIKVIEAVGALT